MIYTYLRLHTCIYIFVYKVKDEIFCLLLFYRTVSKGLGVNINRFTRKQVSTGSGNVYAKFYLVW